MPAVKPGTNYSWAISSDAFKYNPPTKQLNYGWTTSNDLMTGTPQKPIMQYDNGWRYGIYQWIKYFEDHTDEKFTLPLTGQTNNYFLKTNGSSVFSWAAVSQIPTSGQVNGYFLRTNGSSVFTWSAVNAVPADSTVGYILKMTGASTYAWAPVYTSGSVTATMTFGTAGTATLSASGNDRTIFWHRVGNIVTFNCSLLASSFTNPHTGTTKIVGLPYAALYAAAVNVAIDCPTTLTSYFYQARMEEGSADISLFTFEFGDSFAFAQAIPNGTTNIIIRLSGTYVTT